MAIICGPITDTISYVSKSICGHLVKINDIRSMYSTIDVQVDSQVIPGVGTVSVSLAPDFTTRANITLLSKNVAAGTATISISIESIPPTVTEATHYLDVYVKPYSWYSLDGAATTLVTKLADINGAILNIFANITDYKYVGVEIFTDASGVEAPSDVVTIRVKVAYLGAMNVVGMALPLLTQIAIIIAAFLLIIFFVGVITGWKWTLAGIIEQITGKKYSDQEVNTMIWGKGGVVDKQLDECNKNYPDPNSVNGCNKAVICGAANGETDALKLSGTDCTSLNINQKVDACLTQYNIDGDKAKYDACVKGIATNTGGDIAKKLPKETDLTGAILLGVFVLGGLYIVSKG